MKWSLGASLQFGGPVNGGANPQIGDAPADVAVHRRVDVRVRRLGRLLEQRGRSHQLARLAVAALRHVEFLPGALQRVRAVRGESFDGRDLRAGDRRDLSLARPGRRAVDVHGARAALAYAAAELRALEFA